MARGRPPKCVDPTRGNPVVWVMQGRTEHMAYLLEEKENGYKRIKWASTSDVIWIEPDTVIRRDLGGRSSRRRAAPEPLVLSVAESKSSRASSKKKSYKEDEESEEEEFDLSPTNFAVAVEVAEPEPIKKERRTKKSRRELAQVPDDDDAEEELDGAVPKKGDKKSSKSLRSKKEIPKKKGRAAKRKLAILEESDATISDMESSTETETEVRPTKRAKRIIIPAESMEEKEIIVDTSTNNEKKKSNGAKKGSSVSKEERRASKGKGGDEGIAIVPTEFTEGTRVAKKTPNDGWISGHIKSTTRSYCTIQWESGASDFKAKAAMTSLLYDANTSKYPIKTRVKKRLPDGTILKGRVFSLEKSLYHIRFTDGSVEVVGTTDLDAMVKGNKQLDAKQSAGQSTEPEAAKLREHGLLPMAVEPIRDNAHKQNTANERTGRRAKDPPADPPSAIVVETATDQSISVDNSSSAQDEGVIDYSTEEKPEVAAELPTTDAATDTDGAMDAEAAVAAVAAVEQKPDKTDEAAKSSDEEVATELNQSTQFETDGISEEVCINADEEPEAVVTEIDMPTDFKEIEEQVDEIEEPVGKTSLHKLAGSDKPGERDVVHKSSQGYDPAKIQEESPTHEPPPNDAAELLSSQESPPTNEAELVGTQESLSTNDTELVAIEETGPAVGLESSNSESVEDEEPTKDNSTVENVSATEPAVSVDDKNACVGMSETASTTEKKANEQVEKENVADKAEEQCNESSPPADLTTGAGKTEPNREIDSDSGLQEVVEAVDIEKPTTSVSGQINEGQLNGMGEDQLNEGQPPGGKDAAGAPGDDVKSSKAEEESEKALGQNTWDLDNTMMSTTTDRDPEANNLENRSTEETAAQSDGKVPKDKEFLGQAQDAEINTEKTSTGETAAQPDEKMPSDKKSFGAAQGSEAADGVGAEGKEPVKFDGLPSEETAALPDKTKLDVENGSLRVTADVEMEEAGGQATIDGLNKEKGVCNSSEENGHNTNGRTEEKALSQGGPNFSKPVQSAEENKEKNSESNGSATAPMGMDTETEMESATSVAGLGSESHDKETRIREIVLGKKSADSGASNSTSRSQEENSKPALPMVSKSKRKLPFESQLKSKRTKVDSNITTATSKQGIVPSRTFPTKARPQAAPSQDQKGRRRCADPPGFNKTLPSKDMPVAKSVTVVELGQPNQRSTKAIENIFAQKTPTTLNALELARCRSAPRPREKRIVSTKSDSKPVVAAMQQPKKTSDSRKSPDACKTTPGTTTTAVKTQDALTALSAAKGPGSSASGVAGKAPAANTDKVAPGRLSSQPSGILPPSRAPQKIPAPSTSNLSLRSPLPPLLPFGLSPNFPSNPLSQFPPHYGFGTPNQMGWGAPPSIGGGPQQNPATVRGPQQMDRGTSGATPKPTNNSEGHGPQQTNSSTGRVSKQGNPAGGRSNPTNTTAHRTPGSVPETNSRPPGTLSNRPNSQPPAPAPALTPGSSNASQQGFNQRQDPSMYFAFGQPFLLPTGNLSHQNLAAAVASCFGGQRGVNNGVSQAQLAAAMQLGLIPPRAGMPGQSQPPLPTATAASSSTASAHPSASALAAYFAQNQPRQQGGMDPPGVSPPSRRHR